MKVILKDSKEIKEVKYGYAVNYLFPKGLAVLATDKRLEKIKQEEDKKLLIKKSQQEKINALAEKLQKKVFKFKLKTKKGQIIHGSVSKNQIQKGIKSFLKDKNLPKIEVLLAKSLRKIGFHQVDLKIGSVKFKVKIELIKEN